MLATPARSWPHTVTASGTCRKPHAKVPGCMAAQTRGVPTRPIHRHRRQAGGRRAGGPGPRLFLWTAERPACLHDTLSVLNADQLVRSRDSWFWVLRGSPQQTLPFSKGNLWSDVSNEFSQPFSSLKENADLNSEGESRSRDGACLRDGGEKQEALRVDTTTGRGPGTGTVPLHRLPRAAGSHARLCGVTVLGRSCLRLWPRHPGEKPGRGRAVTREAALGEVGL